MNGEYIGSSTYCKFWKCFLRSRTDSTPSMTKPMRRDTERGTSRLGRKLRFRRKDMGDGGDSEDGDSDDGRAQRR